MHQGLPPSPPQARLSLTDPVWGRHQGRGRACDQDDTESTGGHPGSLLLHHEKLIREQGCNVLGSCVGSPQSQAAFLASKIDKLVDQVQNLATLEKIYFRTSTPYSYSGSASNKTSAIFKGLSQITPRSIPNGPDSTELSGTKS